MAVVWPGCPLGELLEAFMRKKEVTTVNLLDSNSLTGGIWISTKCFSRIHSLPVSILCPIREDKTACISLFFLAQSQRGHGFIVSTPRKASRRAWGSPQDCPGQSPHPPVRCPADPADTLCVQGRLGPHCAEKGSAGEGGKGPPPTHPPTHAPPAGSEPLGPAAPGRI